MSIDSTDRDAAPESGGGYRLVPARWLAALWHAYRAGTLEFADVRLALALHEAAARRGHDGRGRYAEPELAALTGTSTKRLRAGLRRLRAADLADLRHDSIAFGHGPQLPPGPLARAADARGRVPVPRRVLRWLAKGSSPALTATALGVVFRCLYLKDGRVNPRGRLKASWVVETFGVGVGRVKAARRELTDLGWIAPDPGDSQAAMNRWGRAYVVNLNWSPRGPQTIPPEAPNGPGTDPPNNQTNPLPRGERNQYPAPDGPAGVCASRPEGKESSPAPKPDLRDVSAADLASTGRLLDLHRQAVRAGLVTDSEADRLRFVAAAEHARSVGKNPPSLFSAVVRRGLWGFLTGAEEQAASRRLRAFEHAPGVGGPSSLPRQPLGAARYLIGAEISPNGERGLTRSAAGDGLSADARLVAEVGRLAGGKADPYLLLRRQSSEWTRERFDRAVAEFSPPCSTGDVLGPRRGRERDGGSSRPGQLRSSNVDPRNRRG